MFYPGKETHLEPGPGYYKSKWMTRFHIPFTVFVLFCLTGCSTDKPGDAFIAVPYRNYWFWIDDRDLSSKTLFSFLMFVFSLTETGGAKEGAPIITVPSG